MFEDTLDTKSIVFSNPYLNIKNMKLFYNYPIARKFGFLMALSIFSSGAFAALSGTYTIDATSNASATNYKTFSSLASDLLSGTRADGGTANGPAVNGAVVVNVVKGSGPYTEQVSFGAISGTSSTNTITINGNGETLQFTATSSASSFTLQLNGTDYTIIDNLVIQSLGSSMGRCVHLLNQADYNTLSNCVLQMPNMTSTSNIYFYYGITNGTSSTLSYANAGKENTVTKCSMSARAGGGPYSGIAIITESSGSNVTKNYITNNKIQDFYYTGIWCYYGFQQTFTGNEMWNTGSSSGLKSGIYILCNNKGGDHTIENNYVHDLMGTSTQYGIYLSASYGTGNGNLNINKNRIILLNTPTSTFGIYVYSFGAYITGVLNTNDNYIQLERSSTGSNSYFYGIYGFGSYYLTSYKQANIDRNVMRITSVYGYGIYGYNYYNSNFTNRASISNNIVDMSTNNFAYGIFGYFYLNNQQTDVAYNTVIMRNNSVGSTSGTKYAIFTYYADGKMHNNNVLMLDNAGTYFGICDYYGTASYSNNNIWDNNAGATFNSGQK